MTTLLVSDIEQDLYKLLGVKPDASHDEIKKAYRKLARATHPDTNPNTRSQEQFEKLSEAYRTLKDPKQRAKYDQLAEYKRPTVTRVSKDPNRWKSALSSFFNQVKQASGPWPKRGRDLLYNLRVSLLDSIKGGRFWIESLRVCVSLPAGVEPEARLRFPNQGKPGRDGGPPGDLIVVVHVEAHPWLSRRGVDLVCKRPLPFPMAVLGGEIRVPTPAGRRTLTIPAGSKPGTLLRIRGMGLAHQDGIGRGDLLIELVPELPTGLTEPTTELLHTFMQSTGKHNYPETQDFEKMMKPWLDNPS